MAIEFTSHNIRLDDGSLTKPDAAHSMEAYPWFISAQRIIETVFLGNKTHLRLADLGCLEGGYAVEFARMGFQLTGVEVHKANMAACNYVKSKTNLPNLTFVNDNAVNIAQDGVFDDVFCSGLLYHLDKPKQFLETLSAITTKLVILQTHFSAPTFYARLRLPTWVRKVLARIKKNRNDRFNLSQVTENEGIAGQWYQEFLDKEFLSKRETSK
jgi:SAM-dependent methyltransferase